MTHAKVFERFLDADDKGTSLCNVGRTPETDLSDVRAGGTEIRAEELGVARERRRSPCVFEPITPTHAPARQGSCVVGPNDRSSAPRSWYPCREPQKRWVRATVRLTPPACVPTMVGRATPSSWSPFLRVGARTLRTEQCAKSQCVYPVDIGRCGSPCLPARRSYGKHHRKADPGVLLGEADFPTHEPETGPHPNQNGCRVQRFSTESLILAQDERWRRA